MDRRRFQRIPVERSATLTGAGGRRPVVVEDLSLRGVRLRLPPGEVLQPAVGYRLTLALAPEVRIEMQLALAHQEGFYAGLHCRQIDLDSIAHLRRLVELNLGDPQLLERELEELVSES